MDHFISNMPDKGVSFTIEDGFNHETMIPVTKQNKTKLAQQCKDMGFASSSSPPEVGDQVLVGEARHLYVVKPLDTLFGIAHRVGVTAETLQQKNHLHTVKLFVGQKLYY